jgi:hypothetical protein
MADNVNPNRNYPDQSRQGDDATVASTPAEPGQGRLDENATLVQPTAVGPDAPPTPGLASTADTLDAMRSALGPGVRSFTAPEWMGSPERGVGYQVDPDGDPANRLPDRGGFGPATER